MVKYIFGKSKAAIVLEQLVANDVTMQRKVATHLSEYIHYVNMVITLPDKKTIIMALSAGMECKLDVPDKVKSYITNIKKAKRREILNQLKNKNISKTC